MRILRGKAAISFAGRLARRGMHVDPRVERIVRGILRDVADKGDAAVRRYAERWDGLKPREALLVPKARLDAALGEASGDFRTALEFAAGNIRKFCEWQKPQEWSLEIQPGVQVGQIIRPLDSAGCYVPSGRYPLVSTLLMTVIPAQVAGVRNIAVACARPAPEILAAAALLGVESFYCIGGAQAIAAFGYGTKSIAPVQKIAGPGNSYVTLAKKLIAAEGVCAIDMLAGPTETVIVSYEGDPTLIAADLVAQAEHDPETFAVFITTADSLAKNVAKEAERLSEGNAIARASLAKNGAVLLAGDEALALALANTIASEHLTVSASDLPAITTAGSVFIGDYSAQPFGDYVSGPNHVLPTGGAARFRGGLGVSDFLKVIAVQEVSREGAEHLAPPAIALATAEGLPGHARAAELRIRGAHA
jgi:histidinol dehydrogenase